MWEAEEKELGDCPGCGKEFLKTMTRQKFCTVDCRRKRNSRIRYEREKAAREPVVRTCKSRTCDATFEVSLGDRVFCSRKCKTDYHNDVQNGKIKPEKHKGTSTYNYQMKCFDHDKDWYFKWATTPLRTTYDV